MLNLSSQRIGSLRSGSGVPKSCSSVPVRRLNSCRASDDDRPQVPQQTALEKTIRRKQGQLEIVLTEMGMETVDERLQSSVQSPATPPYRLSQVVEQATMQGRAALCFEIARTDEIKTSADLAKQARLLADLGADCIVVKTDSDDTPEGLRDLWQVSQAVRVPVIGRDWLIHPYQIIEIKEAGAAGSLGVIHQVNGKGTAIMSSFSAAIGLDAPVEVVNLREVELLAAAGVVFYAINISVGLSVSLPGFAQDMAHGILGNLPFGAISMVGARTIEEASKARQSGADSILVKHELVMEHKDDLRTLVGQIQYLVCGDD